MKLIARSSSPASAGITRSSSSRPSRGVRARIRSRSSSSSRLLGVARAARRRRARQPGRRSRRSEAQFVPIAPDAGSPSTTVERCSSSPISHFAANRARSSSRASRSPASGSVSSRKSSCARRQTTIGATIRAFGVSSSASHASPTGSSSTSFETIRLRYDGGVRRRSRPRRTSAARRPVTSRSTMERG